MPSSVRIAPIAPPARVSNKTRLDIIGSLLSETHGYVPMTVIVQRIYGDRPPISAMQNVAQSLICLRKSLPDGKRLLSKRGGGYRLASSGARADTAGRRVMKALKAADEGYVSLAALADAIYDGVGYRPTYQDSSVRFQVGKLRRSLPANMFIESGHGLGYRLVRVGGDA